MIPFPALFILAVNRSQRVYVVVRAELQTVFISMAVAFQGGLVQKIESFDMFLN